MNRSARFWNKSAHKYAQRAVDNPEAYERKLAETQSYLSPEMDVLEIGCGTGTTAILHAPFANHIHAIDISTRMIDIARDKTRDAGVENVTFEAAAIEDLDVPDARYDMIMAHSILHLVDNHKLVIGDIHRMLKPGGYFVSSTICLAGVMPWLRVVLPVGRALGLFPKVRFFTAENLLNDIQTANFSVLQNWQPKADEALFIIAQKPAAS